MIDNYKLNLSHQEMKDIGFHYDFELEDYTYEFPVYKINNKTSIVCKLGIDEETNKVWLNVYDIMVIYILLIIIEYMEFQKLYLL